MSEGAWHAYATRMRDVHMEDGEACVRYTVHGRRILYDHYVCCVSLNVCTRVCVWYMYYACPRYAGDLVFNRTI